MKARSSQASLLVFPQCIATEKQKTGRRESAARDRFPDNSKERSSQKRNVPSKSIAPGPQDVKRRLSEMVNNRDV